MTQEALKQALEALEHAAYCVQNNYCPDKMGHDWDDTITAIKEALAEPVQRRWVGLTDEDITKIDQGIYPTWKDEVQAVEAKLRELNAPQIDPNQWAFDNGLEST
jgi:uncharacterized membrane protein